jgi:hypothetical protein
MRGSSGVPPRVSVVMAVHNGEPYLPETIRSVLGQTYEDFEFVVVDDGSTDTSRATVESFADARIRLFANESNVGLTRSLNRGLAEARGEFVARIDADDVALPARLARQVAFLDRRPDVALAGSSLAEIGPDGRRGATHHLPTGHLQLRWSLLFHCPFVHSAVMWRREEVVDAVGSYDESFRYAMDWEYWSRIGTRFRVANQREVQVRYRLGPHSMTESHPAVTQEVAAARRASLNAVFGDEADAWIQSADAIFPIMDGWPGEPSSTVVRESISAVRSLRADFERKLGLRGSELPRFTKWAEEWLARRLLFRARKAHRRGRSVEGKMLFAEARRVSPGVVASLDFGRYLGARLLGRRLETLAPTSGRNG